MPRIILLCLVSFVMFFNCESFQQIQIIQTSESGDKLADLGTAKLSQSAATSIPVIEIDPTKQYQEIIGIGGSFTESSAYVLQQLEPEQRSEVINAYFSPEEAAYSLTRTHINSCDFSLSPYAYSNTPEDHNLNDFDISPDLDDLVPLIQDAMDVPGAEFKIVASPWTAPPWMKDNNTWFGGSLLPEYYPAWALYFSKYISAYAEQGIPIWGLTVENEPLGNGANWESMHFTPESMAEFIKNHLGPRMTEDYPDVNIMVYDQNRDHLREWADLLLADPAASEYIWGTAVHWYSSTNDWYPEELSYVHDQYPEKHLVHTEGCIDSDVPVWQDDAWYWKKEATDWGIQWAPEEDKHLHPKYAPVYRYARDIIGGLNNWLRGWIDWNIVLDTQGGPNHVSNWCIAPVIVNTDSKQVYYTPLYYTMCHFSKYIRPGAVRIDVKNANPELMVTAVQNTGGNIVVEILNQGLSEQIYQIKIADKAAELKIPGQALQTLIIE